MNIAICGPSRCGKDTVVNWLNANTKLIAAPSTSKIICPYVAKRLNITEELAFSQRHEHRELWYQIGREICGNDPAFLVKECLKQGNLIQGIRDYHEFMASKHIIDLFIWIEREYIDIDLTMKYDFKLCDIIILNNESINHLYQKLSRLTRTIFNEY